MKKLSAIALALAVTTCQMPLRNAHPQSKTVELRNLEGKVIGTATTIPGRMIVFRNTKGELAGSSSIKNGVLTFFDPHGVVLATASVEDGKAVYRDPAGQIIDPNGDSFLLKAE